MMMTRKKIMIVLLAGAVVIWSAHKFFGKSAGPEVDATLVAATKVQEVTVPQVIHAIGTLTARSVQISPEIPGHVKAILFQDGVAVKAGTPLVQLDDTEYKAKHETAEAQLFYTQKNYERMLTLSKRGIIAQNTIDELNSGLKQKQAGDEESEAYMNKMKLTAPFDGVVGQCKVNPGDYVTTGQGIVTLTDKKNLRIEYNVPESFLPSLQLGQTVVMTTTAYPGKTFTGKLAFIAPAINVDNRSVSLYAEITNNDNLLSPGMFVDVTQTLGSQAKVLMVPARSLVPILDGEQIYKVVDGKVQAVTVKVGTRSDDKVQIMEGVLANDTIITDGQFKVRNGMPVKVKS